MTERTEWERDAVVWLTGRFIGRRQDGASLEPDDPVHRRAVARFCGWKAAAECEADAARFAERVRAAHAARGEGVRRIDQAPVLVRPAAAAPLAGMISAARLVGAAPLVELGVAAGTGRELFDEPCDAWVALPPGFPSGRHLAFRIVGDSMTPLLHSGDVVLADLGATPGRGAVVVARLTDHGCVVKQFGRGDGEACLLRSLNPEHPPLRFASGGGEVLGVVVLRWCAHGPTKPRLALGS